MAITKHREEVINVKLADALAKRGLEADAETIHVTGRPDVMVNLSGVKLVIEGRRESQSTSLFKDAKSRILKALGDISLAVKYEDSLYNVASSKLVAALDQAKFSGAIFFFAAAEIQENHFEAISIDDLAELIRRAFILIVQNDVVRTQVSSVESAIEKAVQHATATNLFFKSQVVEQKLREALAIDSGNGTNGDDGEED